MQKHPQARRVTGYDFSHTAISLKLMAGEKEMKQIG